VERALLGNVACFVVLCWVSHWEWQQTVFSTFFWCILKKIKGLSPFE
jgi:hypothetical protein